MVRLIFYTVCGYLMPCDVLQNFLFLSLSLSLCACKEERRESAELCGSVCVCVCVKFVWRCQRAKSLDGTKRRAFYSTTLYMIIIMCKRDHGTYQSIAESFSFTSASLSLSLSSWLYIKWREGKSAYLHVQWSVGSNEPAAAECAQCNGIYTIYCTCIYKLIHLYTHAVFLSLCFWYAKQ